jgi:hypothetical protein
MDVGTAFMFLAAGEKGEVEVKVHPGACLKGGIGNYKSAPGADIFGP